MSQGDRPATKAARRRALQAVLVRYPVGHPVTDPGDVALLHATLQAHPDAARKIGCGVVSFEVEHNLGSRGFWLTRMDGTRTDWSFYACLTAPTARTEAYAAFRVEVQDQIWAFKDQAFTVQPLYTCPLTGTRLTRATAHADHDPPFQTLVAQFLDGRSLASVAVTPTVDGQTDRRLADATLGQRWRVYHATHARLRLVSARANLSLLTRGRPRGAWA